MWQRAWTLLALLTLLSSLLAWSAVSAKPVLANPGPATHLTFVGVNASYGADEDITITVEIRDGSETVVDEGDDATAEVTLSLNEVNAATLEGDLIVPAVAGVASFTVKVHKAGTAYTLDATSGSMSQTSSEFDITPDAVDHLAVTTTGPYMAGDGFDVEVTAKDQFDNTVPNYTGPATLSGDLGTSSTGCSGPCDPDYGDLSSFSGGTTTGTVTPFVKEVGRTVTATDNTDAGVNGTSETFDVGPGALASTVLTPATATVNADVRDVAYTAAGSDAYANLIGDVTGDVSFGIGAPGSCTGSACGSVTKGPYTVSETTTSTGTASLTITPGALHHFVVVTAPQWPATTYVAGTELDVTITAYDGHGNIKDDYAGSATLSGLLASPGCAECSPTTPKSADYGTVTFTAGIAHTTVTAFLAGGGQVLTATGGGKSGNSAAFTIDPAALHHFTWATITERLAGTSFGISATAYDQYGNVKTNYGGTGAALTHNMLSAPSGAPYSVPGNLTWGSGTGVGMASVTAVRATAFGSPDYAATQHFAITDGPVTKQSGDFGVTPAALHHFSWATITQQTAGSAFVISATAYDQYDNIKTNYTGSGAALTHNLLNSPNGTPKVVPGNLTWGTGTGIGSATVTAVKVTAYGSPNYVATQHFTISDGSVTKHSGDFGVVPNVLNTLAFAATSEADPVFGGGQPLDTKVSSVIYSVCNGAPVGSADPCLATSAPIKVLARDAFGNRKPGVAVAIATNPVTNPTTAYVGTKTGSTADGTGSTPLGEIWFNNLKINVVSSQQTDKYKFVASGGAITKDSTNFRIVSDLAQCLGLTKCINNTTNNSVQKPENSFTLAQSTSGAFGNVITTTNFSNPALDVDQQCAGDRDRATIGSAIDVRVVGSGLTSSKPNTTMLMIIKKDTLKFYGITSRNAASFNVCLGTLNIDGQTNPTPWNGKDKKGNKKAAVAANDADGLKRYWAVAADCSAKFIVKTYDPCITSKTKSASDVAAQMTAVTGETWTVARVNSQLHYANSDIALFINKPYPWDAKGGGY